MNQSELEANTRNLRQARENVCKQVTIVWILLLIGQESGGDFFTNHRAKWSKTRAKRELLSTLNWKPLYQRIRTHTVHKNWATDHLS